MTQAPISVYAIITPLFKQHPVDGVKQFTLQVEHNKVIGINTTILYERGIYIHELFHNNATKHAMDQGYLKVCVAHEFFAANATMQLQHPRNRSWCGINTLRVCLCW